MQVAESTSLRGSSLGSVPTELEEVGCGDVDWLLPPEVSIEEPPIGASWTPTVQERIDAAMMRPDTPLQLRKRLGPPVDAEMTKVWVTVNPGERYLLPLKMMDTWKSS